MADGIRVVCEGDWLETWCEGTDSAEEALRRAAHRVLLNVDDGSEPGRFVIDPAGVQGQCTPNPSLRVLENLEDGSVMVVAKITIPMMEEG